jgi:hypothetical protein
VLVEDTARADASARTVAEAVIGLPDGFDPAADTLPFLIDAPAEIAGCTIRAHLAGHAGTDIRSGDMITTEAIPAQHDRTIAITLRRIG